jgi:CP family cyanate transporter-like MFS transporter
VKAALRWYLPLVIVAAALNLRAVLITVGVVLPVLQRSLALSPFGAGALTALPILALGLAPIVAVPLGRRLGWSGGLIFALTFVGAGALLRSSGGYFALYAGTLTLGVGVGLGNVYVPTLVKARLAGRIGLAMGVYTMLLASSALVSVSLTPALLARFGDWRPALAVWAFPAFGAALLALPLLSDNLRPQGHIPGLGFWRSGLAWAVSVYMGMQSATFYSTALWLGALMSARGMTLTAVAADLSAYYFTQFISALITPVLLTKTRRQGLMAATIAAANGVLVVAVLYAPVSASFALCAVLGLGSGAMFGVALTFQVIRARTADSAARLSSMALCVGYVIASVGPLVLGLVNHTAHARLASAVWLLIIASVTMIAGMFAGQLRFVDAPAVGEADARLQRGATSWQN